MGGVRGRRPGPRGVRTRTARGQGGLPRDAAQRRRPAGAPGLAVVRRRTVARRASAPAARRIAEIAADGRYAMHSAIDPGRPRGRTRRVPGPRLDGAGLAVASGGARGAATKRRTSSRSTPVRSRKPSARPTTATAPSTGGGGGERSGDAAGGAVAAPRTASPRRPRPPCRPRRCTPRTRGPAASSSRARCGCRSGR